jgi:hypothetical protein
MLKKNLAIAALALAATDSHAQSRPVYVDETSDAYKSGFKEGYSQGFREGLAEAQKRGVSVQPPPQVIVAPPRPGPSGPITISSAVYGSDKKSCNALGWLSRRVNGRMTASVDVENSICGDPAPGARKQLEVAYICGGFAKTASAYEHRTLYLDCTS